MVSLITERRSIPIYISSYCITLCKRLLPVRIFAILVLGKRRFRGPLKPADEAGFMSKHFSHQVLLSDNRIDVPAKPRTTGGGNCLPGQRENTVK